MGLVGKADGWLGHCCTVAVGSRKSAEVKKRNSAAVTCLLQEAVQWLYYILHQKKKEKSYECFMYPLVAGCSVAASQDDLSTLQRAWRELSLYYEKYNIFFFFWSSPTQKQNLKDVSR